MDFVRQRLVDLEYLLELDYENLSEHRVELSITSSPSMKNETKQRIKREIIPRIRKYELEYWSLLKQALGSSTVATEIEAKRTVTDLAENIAVIQQYKIPDEVSQQLKLILDKLNEPETAATAKAKFIVSIIPGMLAYEFELDTESALRQAFQPLKKLFLKPIPER